MSSVDTPKAFIKRFFGFSIGPVVGAFIGFVTVPLTTWLVAPEEFGKASMYTTVQQLSVLVLVLGLDQAYVREYNEVKDRKSLLQHSFFIPILLSVLLLILLLSFYQYVSTALFGGTSLYSVLVLGISIISMIFFRFNSLIIRMEEKALLFSSMQIFQKLFNLIFLVLLLLAVKSYSMIITANAVSFLLTGIFCFYYTKNHWTLSFKIDISFLKPLLRFGIPLIFSGIFMWVLNSMDKVALRLWTDFNELGIYANAFRLSALMLIFQQAFTTFWTPTAYRWYANDVSKDRFIKVNNALTFAMILFFFVIVKFKWILFYILEESYHPAVYIFPFLLVCPIMYTIGETTGIGIGFKRKTIFMTLSTITAAIVNLIGNFILVPKYGALGAAIATALSYIVFFWCRTLISNFLWKGVSLSYHLITHIIIVLMLTELYFNGSLSMLWILVITLINYKNLLSIIKSNSLILKDK